MLSTPLTFMTRSLALATVAAVLILTVPGLAAAIPEPAGGTANPGTRVVVSDGRSADTLDAATNAHYAPDWIERYAAAHPYGVGTPYVESSVVADGRSPDTLDAVATETVQSSSIRDGRSPDTLDAATTAHQIGAVSTGGFDWKDAGIRAAAGAGAMIALSFGLLCWLFLRRRHHTPAI